MRRSSLDDVLGKMVGSYRIIGEIGRGGMGRVYKAVHATIGQVIAVKILPHDRAADERAFHRFINEAKLLSQIRHLSLVQVFDFGQLASGDAYLMMELLDGETLRARLQANTAAPSLLPLSVVLTITQQVASALSVAHELGIIHRDIKPENLFLVPDPAAIGGIRVKLIDFGIAKLMRTASTATDEGVAVGTVAYMSPEQCLGERDITAASDIYSLGVVLYEMLAGHPPFQGSTRAVMEMHITTSPPPIPPEGREVPADVRERLAKMLDKQPERRPTAAEICSWLATYDTQIGSERRNRELAKRTGEGTEDQTTNSGLAPAVKNGYWKAKREPGALRSVALRLRTMKPSRIGAAVAIGLALCAGPAVMYWWNRVPRSDGSAFSKVPTSDPRAPKQYVSLRLPGNQVRIPGGDFPMGSDVKSIQRDFDACRAVLAAPGCDLINREQPERRVHVSPFDMDRFEVTNSQFVRWLQSLADLQIEQDGIVVRDRSATLAWLDTEFGDLRYVDGAIEIRKGAELRPIIQVSWPAAQRYCQANGGSLPTEAQWEFAARGAAGRTFPWGQDIPRCDGMVFGRAVGQACGHLSSVREPVGERAQDRTPEGVYDLAGNVAEWVYDCFRTPYPLCPGGTCVDPVADRGPNESSCARVFRGTSWSEMALLGQGTRRSRLPEESRGANIGFRCAYPATSAKDL